MHRFVVVVREGRRLHAGALDVQLAAAAGAALAAQRRRDGIIISSFHGDARGSCRRPEGPVCEQ